jgi:hypothetical protein
MSRLRPRHGVPTPRSETSSSSSSEPSRPLPLLWLSFPSARRDPPRPRMGSGGAVACTLILALPLRGLTRCIGSPRSSRRLGPAGDPGASRYPIYREPQGLGQTTPIDRATTPASPGPLTTAQLSVAAVFAVAAALWMLPGAVAVATSAEAYLRPGGPRTRRTVSRREGCRSAAGLRHGHDFQEVAVRVLGVESAPRPGGC